MLLAIEETGLEVSNPIYIGSTIIDDWRYRAENDKIITLSTTLLAIELFPYNKCIISNITKEIETIIFLNKIKWWNNKPEWFEKNWKLLCDIDKLKGYYGGDKYNS